MTLNLKKHVKEPKLKKENKFKLRTITNAYIKIHICTEEPVFTDL